MKSTITVQIKFGVQHEETLETVTEEIATEVAQFGEDLAADAHRGDFDWKILGLVITPEGQEPQVIL